MTGQLVVSTPLTALLSQVMGSTGALAKQGSSIRTHAKWQVEAITDRSRWNSLSAADEDQVFASQEPQQILAIHAEDDILVTT